MIKDPGYNALFQLRLFWRGERKTKTNLPSLCYGNINFHWFNQEAHNKEHTTRNKQQGTHNKGKTQGENTRGTH